MPKRNAAGDVQYVQTQTRYSTRRATKECYPTECKGAKVRFIDTDNDDPMDTDIEESPT